VKRLLRLLAVLFLTLLPLVATFTPAYAIINPTSIAINSIRVFQNLWESGDMLFVIDEEVMYALDPTETPENTYFTGLFDGAVLKAQSPLKYYQHSVSSVYLTHAQVDSLVITWGNPYDIRVSGNPSYFALAEGTNMRTVAIAVADWVTGTTTQSPGYLGTWVLGLAEDLEADWQITDPTITILTASGKLNATGTAFFLDVIPNLQYICPSIFSASVSYPDMPDYTFTQGYAGNLTAGYTYLYAWVTPASYTDVDHAWNHPNSAFDNDTGTYASNTLTPGGVWSSRLELNKHSIIYTDTIRVWCSISAVASTQEEIDLDAYYNDGWKDVFLGAIDEGVYHSYTLGGNYTVSATRMRFNYVGPNPGEARVNEVDFWGYSGVNITKAAADLGTFFGGVSGGMMAGVGLMLVYFILAGRIFVATGSVTAAVVLSIPFILIGNLIGMLPLGVTFAAGMLILVYFGVTFIVAKLG
jgi:hypothetical protein